MTSLVTGLKVNFNLNFNDIDKISLMFDLLAIKADKNYLNKNITTKLINQI